MRQRVAQNAFIIELAQDSATETWAYETGGGVMDVLSRVRGRGV